MSRHPCPFENEGCRYYGGPEGCFIDEHHLFYPRRDYRTPTEKQFRQLPENRVELPRCEHDEIHATTEPPLKPSVEVMQFAIAQEKQRRIAQQQEVHYE